MTALPPILLVLRGTRSIASPKQRQMSLGVTVACVYAFADRVKVVVRLRPAHDGETGGAMQVSEDGKDIQLLRK